MELHEYDPYRAIGGLTMYAKFMVRARGERDEFWHPVMEAFHEFDDMVLRFEVPGVAPEDLDVRVDGRILWVQGVRHRTSQPPEELSMRDERSYGPFDRSIVLPEGTDPGGVRATYRHGLLEVRVAHVHRPDPAVVTPATTHDAPTDIPVRTT